MYCVVINGLRILWVELHVPRGYQRAADSVGRSDLMSSSSNTPSHVLLVADPQILDQRSYPERGPFLTYLTRLVVDLNLRKNWWAALRKQPDVVVFLGDMMDGGRINMSDEEYKNYYQRFKSIFQLPLDIPTHFIPGNHDIGRIKNGNPTTEAP
ncbi:hypothetical protein H0H92_009942 [Tricholoma furcatifolium]|nr:hypothetical protein H0H92_009942 [Tricholoma furcatifolium]